MTYEISIDGKRYRLEINVAEGRWSCRVDGRKIEIDVVRIHPDTISLRVGNRVYEIRTERIGNDSYISVDGKRFAAEVRDPRSLRGRARSADDHGPKNLTAPMPGKVVRILVSEGAEVEVGAGVIVVEAMKMQNEIKSPKKGTIRKIVVGEGAAVNAGDVLAIVE